MVPRSATFYLFGLVVLACQLLAGCQSPSHADRGALFGGLTGAGVGALVGDAAGDAGAGALIGAGVGAATGTAVGDSLDQIEARNRAQIEAHLGQAVRPGAVTIADVVTMAHSGVSDQLIVTHIQHNGMARPLSAQDIIALKQQNISDPVISAMQAPPARPAPVAAAPSNAPPVVIEKHYVGPPFYYPHRRWHHHRHYRRGPRYSFGFSLHK